MAYFDSPKNRALWEVELKKLREEKELRSQNKGADLTRLKQERQEKQMGAYRVRTSYKELLEEQMQERQVRQDGQGRRREKKQEMEHSRDELSMAPKGKTI